MSLILNTVGWLGTLCVLGSYVAITRGWWSGTSIRYLAVNLCGAAGVGAVTLYQQAWQPFSLQVVWAIITIPALVRACRSR